MPEIQSSSARSNALVALVNSERAKLTAMLPEVMRTEKAQARFFEFALALEKNEKLLQCSELSLRAALYKAAQWGLPVDGVHASLIPYGRDCTYVVGYPGYINVYKRYGSIEDVWAKVAFEGDTFEVSEGTNPTITHVPKAGANHTDPNMVVAAYACARRKDTGRVVFWVMWKDELERLRQRCLKKAYKPESSPWSTDPIEMYRKSPIIRLRKVLPLTEEVQLLASQQEAAELGVEREREPEFEVMPQPTTLADIAKLSKKRADVEAQSERSGNAVDVASSGSPDMPPVRVVQGITITIDESNIAWRDEKLGGKSKLSGLTWNELVFSEEPGVEEMLRRGVAEGVKEESDGKAADKRWQYAALVLDARESMGREEA